FNERTGNKTYCTRYPMPHKQACIMLAKFSKHPSRRMQLERVEKGRFFNDLNETLLRTALASHPQLELLRVWNTEDVRNDCRGSQSWLNAIVQRCGFSKFFFYPFF